VVRPYPYVIFYRPDETGIVILGVRYAARRPL
jgi:plasmid stabilization system protein ParE